MPELPEVETVKRTLNTLIVGKKIDEVIVYLPRIIQKPDDTAIFCDALVGHTVQKVERSGKFLRIIFDGIVLVSHLRMEGRYGLFREDEPLEKHTHVVFHFTDGDELRYKDVRQFGTMHLFKAGEELEQPPLNKLGIEPLSDQFTPHILQQKLINRTSKLKPLLLNQQLIVGLGNIYVDEALYRAGLHPESTPSNLKKQDWERLHAAIVQTLQAAVEAGGSSIKSYVNGQGEMGMFQQQLQVYGRKDEHCEKCYTQIVKFVLGGRGTHICPRCQQKPKE